MSALLAGDDDRIVFRRFRLAHTTIAALESDPTRFRTGENGCLSNDGSCGTPPTNGVIRQTLHVRVAGNPNLSSVRER
jgi:hypothetical protein